MKTLQELRLDQLVAHNYQLALRLAHKNQLVTQEMTEELLVVATELLTRIQKGESYETNT